MSERLATGLIGLIRDIDSPVKFLAMEGVSASLADQLRRLWPPDDPRLPTLAVADPGANSASTKDESHVSVARLRSTCPRGVCVVICEGADIAERQSMGDFVSISPSQLLDSKSRLMLLSEAVTPVRRDGPLAAVRDVLVTMPAGLRPSALAVAKYFDAVAEGVDPLKALPLIGGFRDATTTPAEIRSDRIKENLRLGALRRSADTELANQFANIRERATRVLSRRKNPDIDADTVMSWLESADEEILQALSFDEAREILLADKSGLPEIVARELADFKRSLGASIPSEVALVPWADLDATARKLDRPQDRQQAARDILEFDLAYSESVLKQSTRKKLLPLTRDKATRGTPGSALEVALARAIRALGSRPVELELREPHPEYPFSSQGAARQALSLAIARLRLAEVLQHLETSGCLVDDDLVVSTIDTFGGGDPETVFAEAALDSAAKLPPVQLRLGSATEHVTLDWQPDFDDVAFLRALVAFSGEEACILTTATLLPLDVAQIAASSALIPRAVDPSTEPIAQSLHRLATDTLRDGLRASRLRQWVADWTLAVTEARGFSSPRAAQSALLAGCITSAPGTNQLALATSPLSPMKAEWLADYADSCLVLISDALEHVGSGSFVADQAFDPAAQAIRDVTASHCPPFVRLFDQDEPLLPIRESRVWSFFDHADAPSSHDAAADRAIGTVLDRLLRLRPEATAHLKCLAVGPGAAALMVDQAVRLASESVDGVASRVIEVFVVGDHSKTDGPLADALARADEQRRKGDATGSVRLRYIRDLEQAQDSLGGHQPSVHFALFTGVSLKPPPHRSRWWTSTPHSLTPSASSHLGSGNDQTQSSG